MSFHDRYPQPARRRQSGRRRLNGIHRPQRSWRPVACPGSAEATPDEPAGAARRPRLPRLRGPQPGAHRDVHLPAAVHEHPVLPAGLDAGLDDGQLHRAGQLRRVLHLRGGADQSADHRDLHAVHRRRGDGARAADRPGAEHQHPRPHPGPLRGVRALRAVRRRRRPGVAVHLRPQLRGAVVDPGPDGPGQPGVVPGPGHVADHGDDRVRVEEPGLLRDRLPGRPAIAAAGRHARRAARRRRGRAPLPQHLHPAAVADHLLPADHHHPEQPAGLRPAADHDPHRPRHQHHDLRVLPAGLRRLLPGRVLGHDLGAAVRHPHRHDGRPDPVRRAEGALLMSTPTTTRPGPEAGAPPAPNRRRNGPFTRANLLSTITGGYVPLIVATLVMVLPLLWMIISSFKAPHEILSTELVVLPENPSVANYEAAWNSVPIPRFFLNSVIVTTIGSSIKVLLAIFTAYALVFVRFPFKRIIFVLILVALMVPPQVSILPNYVLKL